MLMLIGLPVLAADIAVQNVELWYLDNVTDPAKPVKRRLESLQDDSFWSKPEYVDVVVTIKNLDKDACKFIDVKAEQYHLLEHDSEAPPYTAMPNELKAIAKKPVWVWTGNLANRMVDELKAGEIKSLTFKHIKIRDEYYATDYMFAAIAVKVFALPRDGDDNYKDNAKYKAVTYGD